MFDKLLNVENKYDELMTKLGTAEVQADAAEYRRSASLRCGHVKWRKAQAEESSFRDAS